MTKKKNKYIYLWVLQGNYGYNMGYEDLTQSESRREIENDYVAYLRDDSHVKSLRIIKRRELNKWMLNKYLQKNLVKLKTY